MRKSLKLAMLALVSMLGSANVRAETLPRPVASYDADITSDVGDKHGTGHINAAGAKWHLALTLPRGPQTLLIDRVANQVYLLVPQMHAAMTIDPRMMGGYDLSALNTYPVTAEGAETISGIQTMRYAVNAQTGNSTFKGHVWSTPDGAILRIDGITDSGDKSTPLKIVLSNFQKRPQNHALFILPPGTQVMPFGLAALLSSPRGNPVPAR